MLKGCATPGFDVAAGAPEAERGVAVVEVSAVMGVERRERVVVKARVAYAVGAVLAVALRLRMCSFGRDVVRAGWTKML